MLSIQALEAKTNIIELDLAVKKYFQTHPPTLGHGYSHLKKVARLSYQLAIKNAFQKPELAYISGLLHDLYRPAMGQAGQEDHEAITAKEAEKILAKTLLASETEKIINAILNHDEIIQKNKATLLMKILSIADKTDMSFQRAVAYTWASNHYLKTKGKIGYKNFMETMRDFCHYQVKAWKVFLAVEIKGVNQAVEAYAQTDEDLIWAVRNESAKKITYQDESLKLAKKETKLEKRFLVESETSKETIRKITCNFSELLS